VLGYTFTRRPGPYDESTFGTRPLADVRADVARAEGLGVDGMFVDNVAPAPSSVPYYEAISRHVRSQRGRFVVFNGAGTPAYLRLADVLIDFEGPYDRYLTWRPPAWTRGVPAARFGQIVFGVPTTAGARHVAALSRARRAGYVYVTDSPLPSPYSRLPRVRRPRCADGRP
jgi:hypothetical protein